MGTEAAVPLAIFDSRGQARATVRPMVARVDVYRDVGAVLDVWTALEEIAPCSVYQTRAWLLPWLDTLGRKAGVRPLFVVARDADRVPVALLCLGVTGGAVKTARWLGGKDANFNMPLVRPGLAWTRKDIAALLRDAARAGGRDSPDLFVLPNQPRAWAGVANPLALLPHQASPSAAHGTVLPASGEDLFAVKLSKDTRKKLRKKEAKLAAFGPLAHLVAATNEDRAAIIDAFLAQKIARFRALGIASDFDAPEMRAFLEQASAHGGIELHALKAGARIVAVYGGAAQGGQWSGMFNAFDADEEIARSSPGDLLLMRIIDKACADRLARFDLGIGEARYKAALCDETIALFDAIVPVTWRGRLFAGAIGLRQRAKGVAKRDPRLFALVKTLRATRARLWVDRA